MSEAIKQPSSPEGIIQMQGVNKWYGQFHVLKDINLNVKQAAADPAWLGMATEGYVFAALVFWIFCFGMSRYSMHLERKRDTGHKR